jgi:hypothetical protein
VLNTSDIDSPSLVLLVEYEEEKLSFMSPVNVIAKEKEIKDSSISGNF